MVAPHEPNPSTRRQFLQLAGLTVVASAVSSSMAAWGQSRTKAPGTTQSKTAAPADTAQATAPPPISEDARTLAILVERRYGKHLTAAQLEAVTREINGRLQGGQSLRAVKLANSDEPDFVFQAG